MVIRQDVGRVLNIAAELRQGKSIEELNQSTAMSIAWKIEKGELNGIF